MLLEGIKFLNKKLKNDIIKGIMKDIREDDLMINGAKIMQYVDGYCFTSDAVFLANFIECSNNENILELGTGSGIISLIIALKKMPGKIKAIEIQERYALLAQRNIELNKLENIIEIECADLKTFRKKDTYDIVIMNPPYFKKQAGLQNAHKEKEISRREICCELEDIFMSASDNLKNKGHFYIVLKADRVQEVFDNAKKYNFAIKRMLLIKPTKEKDVDSIVFDMVKNGGYACKIQSIYVYENDGQLSKEALKFYE